MFEQSTMIAEQSDKHKVHLMYNGPLGVAKSRLLQKNLLISSVILNTRKHMIKSLWEMTKLVVVSHNQVTSVFKSGQQAFYVTS